MIAFDIDGVLVEFVKEIFIPAAKKTLDVDLVVKQPGQYDFTEHFGITAAEEKAVWNSPYLCDFMAQAKPLPHAVRMLETAIDVCFITSRGTHGAFPEQSEGNKAIRGATDHWVRYHLGFPSAPLFFAKPEEKASVVRSVGALVMWDDHPETAFSVADEGTPVFMPVYDYNSHIYHDNVFRVEGWAGRG